MGRGVGMLGFQCVSSSDVRQGGENKEGNVVSCLPCGMTMMVVSSALMNAGVEHDKNAKHHTLMVPFLASVSVQISPAHVKSGRCMCFLNAVFIIIF